MPLHLFRPNAAYVRFLALDRDVFRHVAAYVRFLALDRDVFRHVAAYDPLPLRTGYVQAICHQCGHSFNSGNVMTGGSSGTLQHNTSQVSTMRRHRADP